MERRRLYRIVCRGEGGNGEAREAGSFICMKQKSKYKKEKERDRGFALG